MLQGFEWLTIEKVVTGLFLALIWFVARTMKRIDDNQKLLFERQTKQGERLAELWGEHKALTKKTRCETED